MRRSTYNPPVFNFARLVALGLFILGTLTTSAAVQAHDRTNLDPTLTVTCELVDASKVMRDELKIHFRGVRGYGLMRVTAAQIKCRSAAISRRSSRDPYYRGLNRDVARVEDLTMRLGELVQKAIDCPERLERASGDVRHIVGQANLLLDLAEALRDVVTPYCVPDTVLIEETTYQQLEYQNGARSHLKTPGLNGSVLPRIQDGPTLQAPYDPYERGLRSSPGFETAPGTPSTQSVVPQLIGPEPQLISPQPSIGQPVLPEANRRPVITPSTSLKSVLDKK